jgi:predicted metalloprotease
MKWIGRRQSSNFEDRRGMSTSGKVVTSGGIIGVIVVVVQLLLGGNSGEVLGQLQQQMTQVQTGGTSREITAEEKQQGEFVATVFADTEDVWSTIFTENNLDYRKPTMVLFSDGVQTECGGASAAVGPFYCPSDEKVYMDLTFMNELKSRFGAKGGDFALAYIIAHEVGHHIQTVLGTSNNMRNKQQGLNETDANKLSVALELQADFYAGVFAHFNKQYLERGDIEEAISAANAVGDDSIQEKTQGRVVPDAFTHGTSKQRMGWFMKGYNTGDIKQGNTFEGINNY